MCLLLGCIGSKFLCLKFSALRISRTLFIVVEISNIYVCIKNGILHYFLFLFGFWPLFWVLRFQFCILVFVLSVNLGISGQRNFVF